MNVLFVDPPVHPDVEGEIMSTVPPLAIYLLAGVLRERGYYVDAWDPRLMIDLFDNGWDSEAIKIAIQDFDIIAVSSNSFNWGMAKEFINIVKKQENSPLVICGGIHPTFFYDHIFEVADVDFVILGDGEYTILKLLEAIEKGENYNSIPNLVYKCNGNLYKNSFIQEKTITSYGMPAYDLIPENTYYNLPVETSRGCPFHCTFCSILDSNNWRGLDAETSIKNIKFALDYLENIPICKSIFIIDNLFTANPIRSIEIFDYINTCKTDFTFLFEARCTDIIKSNDLVKSIPSNKVSIIQIGVECGYDDGLHKIRKGLRTEDVIKTLECLSNFDLSKKAFLSFMIGFPWEKPEDCFKTIEFAKFLEEKYKCATAINWWIPLKSIIWDNRSSYGFSFDEASYDDPLWTLNKDNIISAYCNLKIEDIMNISKEFKGTLPSFIKAI